MATTGVAACQRDLGASLPTLPPVQQTLAPEELPIAIVDARPVELAEFNRRYQLRTRRLPAYGTRARVKAAVELKGQLAREMIDEALVAAAAAHRRVQVTDAEVAVALATLAATFPSRESYLSYLHNRGDGEAGLQRTLRFRLTAERLAGDVGETVGEPKGVPQPSSGRITGLLWRLRSAATVDNLLETRLRGAVDAMSPAAFQASARRRQAGGELP